MRKGFNRQGLTPSFYRFYRVGNNFDTDELGPTVTFPSAVGAGVFVALLWFWPIGPYAKKRVAAGVVSLREGAAAKRADDDPLKVGGDVATSKTARASGHPVGDEDGEEVEEPKEAAGEEALPSEPADAKGAEDPAEEGKKGSLLKRASQSFADNTYKQDLHRQSMDENEKAKDIWDNAELYDENAEMLFTYLQVFTACLNSFAHGGRFHNAFSTFGHLKRGFIHLTPLLSARLKQ